MEDNQKSNPEWQKQRRFTFSDIAYNAVEPGVNRSVLLFVNCVFLLLLLTLVLIIQFSTGYKLYMIALITIAFALFIAFNWFVQQIDLADKEKEAKEKDSKKKD